MAMVESIVHHFLGLLNNGYISKCKKPLSPWLYKMPELILSVSGGKTWLQTKLTPIEFGL